MPLPLPFALRAQGCGQRRGAATLSSLPPSPGPVPGPCGLHPPLGVHRQSWAAWLLAPRPSLQPQSLVPGEGWGWRRGGQGARAPPQSRAREGEGGAELRGQKRRQAPRQMRKNQ